MICLCNCLKFQLTYKIATKDKALTWCLELTKKEGHLEEQNKRLQHQLVVGQEIEGCQRNCQERRWKTTPRVHDSQVYA